MPKLTFKPLYWLICFAVFVSLTGCDQLSATQSTLIPTLTPFVIVADADTTKQPVPTSGPAPTVNANAPIWVANPTDQTIIRIDTTSNEPVVSIPIQATPDQVVVGEGGVWVLDHGRSVIFRIDPNSNEIVARIVLPLGTPETIAIGAGSVWVGVTGKVDLTAQVPGEGTPIAPAEVVRIDPKTNEIIKQYSVQPVSQLVINEPYVWVLSRNDIETPVQVLDISHDQGMAVPFKNAPEWLMAEAMAVDSNNLWLFSTAYGKVFHSTIDGHVLSATTFEVRQPTGYADMLLADGSLWAATPWGNLLRIDPLTNHLQSTIDLGVPLTSLIDGNQAIWALSQQMGTLFRIDPGSNQVVAQIQTGNRMQATVVPTPTPRVVVWQPCPDAPTSRLHVNDLAYVTKDPGLPNRVRREPKRDAEVAGYINAGGSMRIMEGPTCAEGWVWWKVRNADVEGWTAEGSKDGYYLIPLYP